MAVTIADITHLRKMTGAGMMDCKNALIEAEGDFEKAIEVIRKKGQAVAAKREDRQASEGCCICGTKGDFAAIVALKCETDFVAKNKDFIDLTKLILSTALDKKPKSLEDLKALEVDGRSISDLITDKIGITGEKMELGAYEYLSALSTYAYIHPGNKLSAIVGLNLPGIDTQVVKTVAMQVAAMNPISVDEKGVPEEILNREKEVAADKARQEGKPENLIERIAQGRIAKFYKEVCLLEQENIMDAKESIEGYLKSVNKDLTVTAFKRVTLNEE